MKHTTTKKTTKRKNEAQEMDDLRARIRTAEAQLKASRTPKKQTPPKPYHPAYGTIGRDVDLGIGILLAEDATGHYEVLGPVATINEAIEIARHDFNNRLEELDHLGDPMHVEVYKVWSRNYDGEYSIAFEIREEDAIL